MRRFGVPAGGLQVTRLATQLASQISPSFYFSCDHIASETFLNPNVQHSSGFHDSADSQLGPLIHRCHAWSYCSDNKRGKVLPFSVYIDHRSHLHSSAHSSAREGRRSKVIPVSQHGGEPVIIHPAVSDEGNNSSGKADALDIAEEAQCVSEDSSKTAKASSASGVRVSVFDDVPMLEEYMRLRASGKHVSPDEEAMVMNQLLNRHEQLQDSPGGLDQSLLDKDDSSESDVGSGDEDEELDKLHATEIAMRLSVTMTERASMKNGTGTIVDESASPEITPSETQAAQGAQETGQPALGKPSASRTAKWVPRQHALTDEELRRDLVLRSLSHEVNQKLNTPETSHILAEGLPPFLLDMDEDKGITASQARQEDLQFGTQLLRLGVVGNPNAGKSTLTNYLVGGKVSAVSSRPETTRLSTLGAFTDGTAQVVMYDTPGMHGSRDYKSRSHAMRVAATWTNVADCDMLAFIVDGEKQLGKFATRHVHELAEALGHDDGPGAVPGWNKLPVILLLNKVDQIGRPRMREFVQVAEELGQKCKFERVFLVSAKVGHGMADLREYLTGQAKPSKWDLPAGAPTDQDWPDLAAELVREKLYWNHKNELPYSLAPRTVNFQEHADGRIQIEQEVLVRTQRVKKMVCGADNERITRIQWTVGAELAHMMRRRIDLSLKVKVRKDAALPMDLL